VTICEGDSDHEEKGNIWSKKSHILDLNEHKKEDEEGMHSYIGYRGGEWDG